MYAQKAELEKEFNRKVIENDDGELPIYYDADGFLNPSMPVIDNDRPDSIQLLEWGLLPFWVKDQNEFRKKTNTLNAKAETIFTLASYKGVAQQNHCLIITTGFYEPHRLADGSTVYYFIRTRSRRPFTFGGLWSEWKNPDTGEKKKTYTMLTVPPTPVLAKIHNAKPRMPFIVPEETRNLWLSRDLPKQDIDSLMQTYTDTDLEYWPCQYSKKRGFNRNTVQSLQPIETADQKNIF